MSGWTPGPEYPPEPPRPPAKPGASATTAAPAIDFTDGEWHRLHPATPLLKGGFVLIVVLGIFVNSAREQLVEFFLPGPDGRRGGQSDDPVGYAVDHGLLLFVVLGIVALLVVIVAIFYVSWRMNTFRVTADTVEVRSGVFFRTNRRARLDRIQGINVQRQLFARIFGAAKLEINQAGNDANVPLAYLRSASAEEVRSEILRRASGRAESEREAAGRAQPGIAQPAGASGVLEKRLNEFLAEPLGEGETEPRSVVRMHLGRLIGSAVLSGFTLFLVAIIVAVVVSIVTTGEYFLLFVFFPTLLGSFSYYSRRVVKSLRYSIASTPDGIRIGWGLLSTSNETLPPGRVHSIRLSQPLAWRPFGWWEVKINRASHSSTKGADNQANTTILPVGSKEDVTRVLELILPQLVGLSAAEADAAEALAAGHTTAEDVVAAQPELAVEKSSETLSLIEAGMTSSGDEGGFTNSPRRAAVLRWFSWRRNGFREAPGAVLLRKGAIWRQLIVVPLPRVQSVGITQGPLLRRLGLAALQFHTVQGPITASIGALDQAQAAEFFETSAAHAVGAARADQTHRWLEGVGDAPSTSGRQWPAPDPSFRRVDGETS